MGEFIKGLVIMGVVAYVVYLVIRWLSDWSDKIDGDRF